MSRGTARPAPTKAPTKAIVDRKDGRELRRMTIYLSPAIARRLKLYAARMELDMSGALDALLDRVLDPETS